MNNENFDLELNMDVENFNLTPNDEDEEFTVEFGEVFNDGGTHDYNELDNKPQINGNTLEGNKTNEQLGIPVYTEGTGITLSGNTISADTDVLATKADLNSKQNVIADLPQIRNGASAGATAVQPEDLARVATTGNYNDLNNKPTIPTVNNGTLTIQRNGSTVASFTANSSTNRTANISVPTATSQLTNDSGYTTNTGTITSVKMNGSTVATSGEANLGTVITDVSEKQNITDNALETNNKTVPGAINEVNSIAKGSNQALSFANYSAMVTEFNSLAGNEYSVGQNVMVVTLEVPDLWISGIESTSSTYTYTTDEAFTTALATNGYVQVGYYKLSALETQKVDLTDYVTNTDYASLNTGGVIKLNTLYGVNAATTGTLIGVTKDYSNYESGPDLTIIDKGTLENVITGKGLVSNTDYADTNTAGVIKPSLTYATSMTNTGVLYGDTITYANYPNTNAGAFISKGTLENVIDGKGLVSNTDYATTSIGGVTKVNATRGTAMTNAGTMQATIMDYQEYQNAHNQAFVGKGTLENVIAGKGLVSNTDYATTTTGGVIKLNSTYATQASAAGIMRAVTKSYVAYKNSVDDMFISKGTLENVFDGRGLLPIITLTQAEYDALATKDPDTYYYIEES